MSLAPVWRIGDLDLTAEPYLVRFGADHGSPENITDILRSLLQDGDIELSSRTGNRTLMLPVLIEGADMVVLAEAEAALVAECDKVQNDLYVDPGDGFGAPMVFTVFRGQLVFDRDDEYERAGYRSYTLTFRALPFPRSTVEVEAAALAATGTTTTLVNDGSATTNWTGAVNGVTTSPSVVSGAVKVASSAVNGGVTVRLTLTTAITTSSTKYLMIDWKPETGLAGGPNLRAYGDNVELQQVSAAPSPPTAGFTRTWFLVPAAVSSIAALKLESYSYNAESGGILGYVPPMVRSLAVDAVNRTDVKPAIGTNRQLLRSIEVAGSTRTQGRVAVEHASSSLDNTIVYVFPETDDTGQLTNGYSPPLRQYRTNGGTVTGDAARVSGSYEPINAVASPPAVTWDVPVSKLIRGSHVLVGYMASPSGAQTATLAWTASTYVGATQYAPILSGTTSVVLTTAYQLYPLIRIQLPLLDVDLASAAFVRITLALSVGVAPRLDEAWIFNTSIGSLVMLDTLGERRLWLDPASTLQPRPTVRIGTASDRSDSRYPSGSFFSWQTPEFKPPRVNVLTVTSGALDASVTLRHFPRWHSHAAS